uniref:Uncharacterized protein n=1 Tax=viral metagenome TaxID=1070528 RepID=A0A6C0JHP7_9ZZZZ
MFCAPVITYILICLLVLIQYPTYSLTAVNMINNLFQCLLLYYLCSIGWKRIAWAIVIIPALFVFIFFRKSFNDYASSFEVNNKKSKK